MAHDIMNRNATEQSFVQANKEQMTMQALFTPTQQSRRESARVARKASSQVPHIDSPRIPVILVNYTDVKLMSSDPVAAWTEQICTPGATSVYQYFYDQSFGKFTPKFDIYGPYTLSGTRATYGGNDSSGNDVGVGTMVGEACSGLDASIDWSQYDNDGDGVCDVVIVLYAGVGEASSSVSNSVWPCQWNLASSDYGKNLTLDGVTISKFAVFNEAYGSDDSKLDGIGTMCHEFSHCLGLPDFYATDYSNHFGMGSWSLLDYGSYNNNGYLPCGYTAYERNFMGWYDYTTPVENTKYTTASVQNGGFAIKVTSDNDDEYYVIENIEQNGWNAYAPASGLQVTHVNYSSTKWSRNVVNNSDDQGMTIIPADNSLSMTYYSGYYYLNTSDEVGDLYPYSGNTALTSSSSPAATLYNSDTNLDKPITSITKNSDGTVSYWYMAGYAVAPVATDATNIHSTSATCNWNACDDAVSYTLRINPKPSYDLVFTEAFSGCTANYRGDASDYLDYYLDNTGWSASKVYITSSGLQIGGSNSGSSGIGTLTSPALALSSGGGKATVIVTGMAKSSSSGGRPGGSSSSSSSMTVTLGSGTSQTVTFTSTSTAQTYTLVFDCDANDTQSVKFATTSANNGVVLSKVIVYSGDATAEDDGAEMIFTGITTNSYTVTGLTPNTTYIYDVKAIYADNESDWSNKITFTTTDDATETVTLKELVSTGSDAVGNDYTISDDLQVVAIISDSEDESTILLLKDANGQAVDYVTKDESYANYTIRAEYYFDDNTYTTNKKAQTDYDQSNWLEVVVPNATTDIISLEGTIIKGGSVTGTYTDALNPRMTLTSGTSLSGTATDAYDRNVMCPANFVGSQKGNTSDTYFFMTPKSNEYVQVVWAVYYDGAFYCPAQSTNANSYAFEGYIPVGSFRYNSSNPSLTNGSVYQFQSVVKHAKTQATSAPRKATAAQSTSMTTNFELYPINLNADNIITGVDGVVTSKAVDSVEYYNLQGMTTSGIQPGVNIVVTRYTDGTHTTAKIVR